MKHRVGTRESPPCGVGALEQPGPRIAAEGTSTLATASISTTSVPGATCARAALEAAQERKWKADRTSRDAAPRADAVGKKPSNRSPGDTPRECGSPAGTGSEERIRKQCAYVRSAAPPRAPHAGRVGQRRPGNLRGNPSVGFASRHRATPGFEPGGRDFDRAPRKRHEQSLPACHPRCFDLPSDEDPLSLEVDISHLGPSASPRRKLHEADTLSDAGSGRARLTEPPECQPSP